MQVFLVSTGSLLNNWAYAYNVPLTIAIVFRSAGTNRTYYLTRIAHHLRRSCCFNALWDHNLKTKLFSHTNSASDYDVLEPDLLLTSRFCSRCQLFSSVQEQFWQRFLAQAPQQIQGILWTIFLYTP